MYGFAYFIKSTASERYFEGVSNIFSGFARFCPVICVSDTDLERVHIFQVKTSLKFFEILEKKIRTPSQFFLIAS